MVIYQLTAIDIISNYAPGMLQRFNSEDLYFSLAAQQQSLVIVALSYATMLLFLPLNMFLIDSYGRRALLLTFLPILMLSLLLLAFSFFLHFWSQL